MPPLLNLLSPHRSACTERQSGSFAPLFTTHRARKSPGESIFAQEMMPELNIYAPFRLIINSLFVEMHAGGVHEKTQGFLLINIHLDYIKKFP